VDAEEEDCAGRAASGADIDHQEKLMFFSLLFFLSLFTH
jgi:hypothetical protein